MASPSTSPAFLNIDGKEYVVLPKSEYQRLTSAAVEEQLIDAKPPAQQRHGADHDQRARQP